MGFYKLQIFFYKRKLIIFFITIISLVGAVVILEIMNKTFIVKFIATLLLTVASWGLIALATALNPKDYNYYISGRAPEGSLVHDFPRIGKMLIFFEKGYKYILFIAAPIIMIYFVFFR